MIQFNYLFLCIVFAKYQALVEFDILLLSPQTLNFGNFSSYISDQSYEQSDRPHLILGGHLAAHFQILIASPALQRWNLPNKINMFFWPT